MPIDQVTRVNQIEKFPKPEKSALELGTSISLEAPKVEFGEDQMIEKAKSTAVKLPSASVTPALSSAYVADPRFKKIESILEEDLGDI